MNNLVILNYLKESFKITHLPISTDLKYYTFQHEVSLFKQHTEKLNKIIDLIQLDIEECKVIQEETTSFEKCLETRKLKDDYIKLREKFKSYRLNTLNQHKQFIFAKKLEQRVTSKFGSSINQKQQKLLSKRYTTDSMFGVYPFIEKKAGMGYDFRVLNKRLTLVCCNYGVVYFRFTFPHQINYDN